MNMIVPDPSNELPPNIFSERLKKCGLLDEEDYLTQHWGKVRDAGFIRDSEKEDFQRQYSMPLYRAYIDTLINNSTDLSDLEMLRILEKLNVCLEKTYRVGVTEPANVIAGIRDVIQSLKDSRDVESELAMYYCSEFGDKVSDIVTPKKLTM